MCRERSELIVPVVEKHIAIDQECTDTLLSRRRKSFVDLIHGAGAQDNHLLSDAMSSRLDVCRVAKGIGRIREKADQVCLVQVQIQARHASPRARAAAAT